MKTVATGSLANGGRPSTRNLSCILIGVPKQMGNFERSHATRKLIPDRPVWLLTATMTLLQQQPGAKTAERLSRKATEQLSVRLAVAGCARVMERTFSRQFLTTRHQVYEHQYSPL